MVKFTSTLRHAFRAFALARKPIKSARSSSLVVTSPAHNTTISRVRQGLHERAPPRLRLVLMQCAVPLTTRQPRDVLAAPIAPVEPRPGVRNRHVVWQCIQSQVSCEAHLLRARRFGALRQAACHNRNWQGMAGHDALQCQLDRRRAGSDDADPYLDRAHDGDAGCCIRVVHVHFVRGEDLENQNGDLGGGGNGAETHEETYDEFLFQGSAVAKDEG